jgi:hypothetical protein
MQAGNKSLVGFWTGGAAKPLSTGTYAGPVSLLAFWIGGANFHFVPTPIIPPSPPISDVVSGGLPYARHHGRPIDDNEILEFLEIWTTWNDNE